MCVANSNPTNCGYCNIIIAWDVFHYFIIEIIPIIFIILIIIPNKIKYDKSLLVTYHSDSTYS